MRSRMPSSLLAILALAMLTPPSDADGSVREIRVQHSGDTTFVLAILRTPDGLQMPIVGPTTSPSEGELRDLAVRPRLVPQEPRGLSVFRVPESMWTEAGLPFVGRWRGGQPPVTVRCRLLYPVGEEPSPAGAFVPDTRRLMPRRAWRESDVTLDLRRTRTADNLERLWAEAWSAELATLEAQSHGLPFFGLAREALARRYGVRAPARVRGAQTDGYNRLLYDDTVSVAIVTAELRRRRLAGPAKPTGRTVKLADIPGIEPIDAGWKKRLEGRTPSREPLAALAPDDNWFVRFRDVGKFITFLELIEDWSERAAPDLELKRVVDRYETQLGLSRTAAAKTLGPLAVRSLAATGSDPHLREGSDVTVLVHPISVNVFALSVDILLAAARVRFGGQLKEEKSKHHDTLIQSLVTPRREFSLYRARAGDFYLLSNSAVAIRRALDAHAGRLPALADSSEFRYLQSSPNGGKPESEDGLLFVPDAFLRKLTGPAGKIQQRRRLEARTSLAMVTSAALFAAWDGGQVPADLQAALEAARLRPEEVATPDGKAVVWDGAAGRAWSETYGTLQFLTPLVELPLERVTEAEAAEYRSFRTDYLAQPRYGEATCVRMTLGDHLVKLDATLLPLSSASPWRTLRKYTGGEPLTVSTEAGALIRADVRLSEAARRWYSSRDSLGDSARARLFDGAGYLPAVELGVRRALRPEAALPADAAERLAGVPALVAVGVKDRAAFDRDLKSVAELLYLAAGPFRLEPLKPAYRGVTITRVRFGADSLLTKWLGLRSGPVLYHAHVGDRWCLSLSESAIQRAIDRNGGSSDKGASAQVAAAVSPREAVLARPALRLLLEWESHRRAWPGNAAWYPLYRSGLLAADAPPATQRDVALRYLGFVPVSPEGAVYVYDPIRDEVVNRRHGSLRRPELLPGIDETSPLGSLLEQFAAVQAEVTFPGDEVRLRGTIDRTRSGSD